MTDLIDLELSRLKAITAQFGVCCQSVRRNCGGFSDAQVFHVTSDHSQEFALRRMPRGDDPHHKDIRSLHRLLAALSKQGLEQIARPLTVPVAGSLSEEMSGARTLSPETLLDRADGIWQLEPWMPGSPRTGQQLTTAHIESALWVLGRFYSLSVEYVLRQPGDSRYQVLCGPSAALQRRTLLIQELLDGELNTLDLLASADDHREFRQLARELCRCLRSSLPPLNVACRSLHDERFSLQPVIRDLWSEHVLFTDDRVTGLIDLNASGIDHVAVDLARLQRSWYGNEVDSICAMVHTFQQHRRFEPLEWELWRVLDACCVLLSPVTWLRRRCGQSALWDDSTLHRMLGRFEMLVTHAVDFRALVD